MERIWKLTTHSGNRCGENRHLWNNRGYWWITFTVTDGAHSIRVRKSLKTSDLAKARARRDKVMAPFVAGITIRQYRKVVAA